MEKMIRAGIRILEPVILHFFVINIVQMMRLHVDAAFLTTLAAILVLPVFLYMMKQDGYTKKGQLTVGMLLKSAAAGVTANVVLTVFLNGINEWMRFGNETQEALLSSNFWVQLLGIGMIVPIMEEVLFRGLVYNRLKDYNKRWSSIFLAAGIFAVYHGNALQILFAFPMAVIILVLYEKWGTLTAPVMFHMAVNLSSIFITRYS